MSFIDKIFDNIDENELIGLNNELKSLYVYEKFKNGNDSVILVTSNLYEAELFYNSLINYTDKVWLFPMDNFITSEAVAVSPEFKITRLETMNSIIEEKKTIIVTNLMGYLRFLPSKEKFKNSKINLKVGNSINIAKLIKKLFNLGYRRETTVNMTGEIAVRGYVIDIFPINNDNPIRLEFWGDEIDSIRTFNIESQLTISKINEVNIFPNTEIFLGKNITNISGYINKPITIYNNLQTLMINYNMLLEEMENYSISLNKNPKTKYMFGFDEVMDKNAIIFEEFYNQIKNNKSKIFTNTDIEIFPKDKKQMNIKLNNYLKTDRQVIICLDSRYQVTRLIDFLENNNLTFTNENRLFFGKLNIIIKKLNSGFMTDDYVVITEKELFDKHEENSYKTKFRYGTRIKDITKLEIGDYVVHGIHGIGRYDGLKTIIKNKLKKDYLAIIYRDNDKLYIPVEKLDLITKYSSGDDTTPKLSKLGSREWQKIKGRARRHAEDIAKDLLEMYAIRESKKGFAFEKDGKEQIAFEKEFNYEETPDQLRVTEEIKKDMESDKPMDRLLCGDVGYGKTEVAFRAIFKATISGKQAAILCPTTILSSQHFQNAIKRFRSFPVYIALLNRFISSKETKEILEKLEKGQIDLLIGTHRILSDDIKFKDLGLLIIDEEQRFGVKHKEKIKKYKNNIDVLTLSATPIPRTLQMSIAGIRSLSLIETPPIDRYPIQTYVLAENKQVIKDAIYKELARKGQVFVLYNKVNNIENEKIELQKIVPEAKIGIAHGQMNKNTLEQVMMDFIEKKYNVLLCTTIIETGIDIKEANTLIIINADHFGLSQLYQIRGRIGRSNKIAYCYLMYAPNKILSEVATKKLKVIKDFTELGSGLAIAMRDLSIRGAGDILGSKQAGFIDSIGIELFMQMLNEEVAKLKGEKRTEEIKDIPPLINVATAINDNFVSDEDLKIEIHKKICSIDSYKLLNEVKQELEDRFGKLSDDLIIYMHEELFEKEAQKLNIKKIKQTKNFIEITLDKDLTSKIDSETLFLEATNLSRMFRFSMKFNRLIITLDIIKLDKHFIYYLLNLLYIISKSLNNNRYG